MKNIRILAYCILTYCVVGCSLFLPEDVQSLKAEDYATVIGDEVLGVLFLSDAGYTFKDDKYHDSVQFVGKRVRLSYDILTSAEKVTNINIKTLETFHLVKLKPLPMQGSTLVVIACNNINFTTRYSPNSSEEGEYYMNFHGVAEWHTKFTDYTNENFPIQVVKEEYDNRVIITLYYTDIPNIEEVAPPKPKFDVPLNFSCLMGKLSLEKNYILRYKNNQTLDSWSEVSINFIITKKTK